MWLVLDYRHIQTAHVIADSSMHTQLFESYKILHRSCALLLPTCMHCEYERQFWQISVLLDTCYATVLSHTVANGQSCYTVIIIIITNVLIKVTLNEIRCRGTLQSQWSTLTESTSLYIKAEESVNVWNASGSHTRHLLMLLTIIKQPISRDNPDKLVQECHQSGFYWSQRRRRWWWQLELQDVQSSSQIITINEPILSLYTEIDKLARTARFFQQRKLTSVLPAPQSLVSK